MNTLKKFLFGLLAVAVLGLSACTNDSSDGLYDGVDPKRVTKPSSVDPSKITKPSSVDPSKITKPQAVDPSKITKPKSS